MNNQSSIRYRQPGIRSAFLLLGVGVVIALMLPLSRAAMDIGMTPLAYAFWQALGGGVILAAWLRRRSLIRLDGALTRYFGISGLTAIAVPNALAFAVVSQIGAGLTATLYALPSLATYAIAVTMGMESLSAKKAIGLGFGVAGCVWILSPSPAGISPDSLPWLLLGLLVPLSLAIGNIYRTSHWPTGATPEQLAIGMLLGGAVLIFMAMLILGDVRTLVIDDARLWAILGVQSILTAIGYRGFFHLQQQTSPTFLSQLGFVITPAGMLFGIVFYGESYGWAVWGGVVLLLTGVVLANLPSHERKTCSAD
ncbi:DMT family transporter [Marinobacter sp. TBZ242]|uniref:DMT family transporter n=1 Tax=Marinobacter azerbaijanicus TaxID=3050455 RepID=A0ABT7IH56_9GAMM|nr:DMT family transporter [Marinobacter sp. TBZ242]MDL0433486.1 DMT family transporter [Marinobacter sp. TBZ242]